MNRHLSHLLSAAALLALVASTANAEQLYATSGTDIARFDSATPTVVLSVPLTGLQAGETIVGIDVRPATQGLYGIGSTSRIYTINPTTGAATAVGAGAFTPALSGTKFGVDFNPVPDRIRLVSNTQQNLRLHPDTGAVAATDVNLSSANIAEVAYANNSAGVTSTTLYAIDSSASTLNLIGSINGTPNSPNGGVVTSVGPLGVALSGNTVGFDISGTGTAYASLASGGINRLYTVNLSTGAATLVGNIGAGATPYVGLAAAQAPEPGAFAILAIATIAPLMRRRPRKD